MTRDTRTPRTTRRVARTAVAAAATLALAGCAAPLPEPAPEPAGAVPPPAVSVDQTQRVLASLGDVLTHADATKDPAGLPDRLVGPALATRTAEYVWANATGGARQPTALPLDEQALVVPETATWPRTQLVVSEQPDDLQAPRVLVLQQASPREPYKLWGWARLLQGVQMPPTAAPEEGSPELPADAEGLVVPPAEVGARYADVLTNGDASEHAPTFALDSFRAAVEKARADTTAALQDAATLAETYVAADAPVVTLGTVDGGALVVTEMTTTSTVSVTSAGGTIAIEPFYAALAGTTSAGTSFSRVFTDVLVVYVPPADSGAQAQVLAAEHTVTSASAQ
ncbi:hypothetical protein [Cellulomonas shaoxiangyii]|uniref:hypothetical protein n=1 Tax=Cellulomonas shaoxiangyii TaxID=2566013 RepID=UPI001AA038FB|nr:hypothetical protein [Cellulomonas shaoxiangyii]